MFRTNCSTVWVLGLAATLAGTMAGCANMIEYRAISAFAKSLEEKDLAALKEVTSDDFNRKVLRAETSLDDMKHLRLPDGKPTVMKVEPVEGHDDRRRVTVQMGDTKKEVFYEIERDSTGKWVVDDIYLKQKKKGLEVYKSVTEQMDLLLTVREFLDAWSDGDRDQVLATTSPRLRSVLETLPPSYLAQMTQHVVGKSAKGKFQPVASMDENVAVVRLPRQVGQTVVTMELKKGKWWVGDVAIDSREEDEKLPSLINLAHAVNRCVQFLSAYQTENKSQLSDLCSKDFFEGSLSFAELSQAKLPEPELPEHELQVRLRGSRADFILKGAAEFVQIDMQRQADLQPDEDPIYVVSDVTIYETATKQEKRLSALFTAQGMLDVFLDALRRRELAELKHCSTQDFASRVWQRLNEATVSCMPLESLDSPQVQFEAATFMGALTKIEVQQDGHRVTYLLRDEGGRFKVDDVHWQMTGVPASVKSTLEVLIPIQDLAAGITLGRDPDQQEQALDLIRGNSSNEFNRMVWSQAEYVPNSGMSADSFLLRAPLRSMAIGEKEVVVNFGDQQYGAKVTVRRESERFAVDDIVLIAGPEESQRLVLKQTLRTLLAKGEARRPDGIVQASHMETPQKRVQQANYEVPAGKSSSDASPSNPPRELPQDDDDPFETLPLAP